MPSPRLATVMPSCDAVSTSDSPLRVKVKNLSIGQQQVVEIAKAMSFNPSVLILDEPTSALARNETEGLFKVIRNLKEKGVAILYVTHRLHELYDIADTVSVLRDGKYVGSVEAAQATPQIIVDLMFAGRPDKAGEFVSREVVQ
jgi:ABC-type sugar transport system ATPase subunit